MVLDKDGEDQSDRSCERNAEMLDTAKVEKHILHIIKRRKPKWIGHILRRNCLLKQVIEGKIERRSEWKTGKKK